MNNMVMCVDDEEEVNRVLIDTIQRFGYDVVCATNVDDAIVLFEEYKPFLVLSDLVLEGNKMDGITLVNKLHNINPICVFIAITGFLSSFDFGYLLGSIFTDVLIKPISMDILKTVINYAHEKHIRWTETINSI